MRSPLRWFLPVVAVLAFGVLAAGCADQALTPTPSGEPQPVVAMTGAVAVPALSPALTAEAPAGYVLLTAGSDLDPLVAAIAAAGGQVEHRFDAIRVLAVSGLSAEAAAALDARGDVVGVALDAVLQWVPGGDPFTQTIEANALNGPAAQADQSSAQFFQTFQWNMRQIDANLAWTNTDQGTGALACILDTGVDPGHLDLIGKVDLSVSRSFITSEPFIEDLNFHGTFVSALVSSRGIGIASVAPNARLCAVKVLSRTGSGPFSAVIAGIIHATDVRADVMNLSLGAYINSKAPGALVLIEAIQNALDYAHNRGTLVVAASGNQGLNLDVDTPDFIHIPSQLQYIMSVGATAPINQQNFDMRASYSNFGTTGVDLMAPGGDRLAASQPLSDLILSPCSRFASPVCAAGNVYVFSAGTSFAAPHVTGAAVVFATNRQATGGDNTDLVKRYDAGFLDGCIIKGVERVNVSNMDVTHGHGRLNVERTMLCGSSPRKKTTGTTGTASKTVL